MAGQTYQVNYIVNVDATNAQTSINAFKRALTTLDKATKPIVDLQRQVRGLIETMGALHRGSFSIKIDTSPATKKIGKLIRALQMAQKEVSNLNAMGVRLATTSKSQQRTQNRTTTSTAVASSNKRVATSSAASRTTSRAIVGASASAMRHPTNLGYKLWGPTPLPNNGGMAIDMLKGMGIAYGIAGIGTLISNIVDQSTEYDSLIKTVENILKTHDEKGDFSNRFTSMTQTIRNVGMETKFKVTEVADAAKFLAMAGLDLEGIQQAIRPIADIALVGDTELGKTADLVTNIMTAYNIAPSKMRNAADIMTNTFTMSNTTLTEIAESYKYAASLLSAGGVSFEEATAAIGVLGDAGIKGSQAGTTMRTIMANIVNPTKKQQAAWDAIGISRTDESGKVKDLLTIFKELNEANLGVDAYYKIFHKTAASGAVALTSHVDKWDKIYLENFLASGLSARLADEKKNTLQGLWAQLSSVFTDRGVSAFGNVKGGIRGMITQAIDWLKDEDENGNDRGNVAKKFREFANSIMEFVRVIIDASKWFFRFYEMFAPMIKMWFKFQLTIWPVVKAITALRSVFLSLLGLRKVSSFLLGLVPNFKLLGHTISSIPAAYGAAATATGAAATATGAAATATGAAATATGVTPFGFTAGIPNLPGLTYKQYMQASKGLNLNRPHAVHPNELRTNALGYSAISNAQIYGSSFSTAPISVAGLVHPTTGERLSRVGRLRAENENWGNLENYRRDRKIFEKRVRKAQLFNSAKAMGKMGLGTAGVMLGMSQMTKENANDADMWSGGLFAAAGTAAMVGGQVGWIAAAVLALGGITASLISFKQNLASLSEFVQSFSSTHTMLDGAMVNANSRTERSLEFVWRRYYDINDLIQRRIELTKELLGIESPSPTTDKDVDNTVYKTMYEKFYAADSKWGSSGAAARAAQLFNKYGEEYGLQIGKDDDGDWVFQTSSGRRIKFANPKGSTDSNDVVMYEVAAAMELLHGSYRTKIIEENQSRLSQMLYGKSTAADVAAWRDTFKADYGPASFAGLIQPNQRTEDTDVAKYWNGEEIATSWIGKLLVWNSLSNITKGQNAIIDFKNKLASKKLTEGDVVSALRWGDKDVLGTTLGDYDSADIAGWYRNLGYYGNGVWKDPRGRETPEVMAQTAAEQMARLLESIKQLGLESDPATEGLRTYATTLLTLAQSFTGENEAITGQFDGQIKEINGQKWRWNALTRYWELIDDNNQPAEISEGLVSLSNNMYGLLTAAQHLKDNWPTFLPIIGWQNGELGYNGQSPYDWGDKGFITNGIVSNPLFGNDTSNLEKYFPSLKLPVNPQAIDKTYTTTHVSMSPEQMGNAVKVPTLPATTTPGIDNTTNPTSRRGGGGGGAKSSDYKSKYKNQAAPKQINLTIQNLMNVEKIDLSSPEKAEVVRRLKSEVAYALYEAAADSTLMLNNLAH